MSKTKAAKAAKKVGKGFLLPVTTGVTGGVVANQFPQNRRSSKSALKEMKKSAYPFENEGPDFNHRAARAMYDIVSKMDPDSAQMFAEIVISDVLEANIEKNLPEYQRRLDQVIEKRLREVSKAVLSRSDDPEAKGYAEAIGMISKKSNPYDYGYRFNENDFNRDPHTGMFRMKVKHQQNKPVNDKIAQAMGINGTNTAQYRDMSPADKAVYQDEYRQLAGFLNAVYESTGGQGNSDVLFHTQSRNGDKNVIRTTGSIPMDALFDPDTRITGVVARPTTLTAGGAAFGLVPALSPNGVKGVNAAEGGFDDFASAWTNAGDKAGRNSNQKHYDRLSAGGSYLYDIGAATNNQHLMAASKLAQLVGTHGREAEAVFGPTARKTAYRYRGTEKTPDRDIVYAYNGAVQRAKGVQEEETRAGRSGRSQTPPAASQMGRARALRDQRDPTWQEINAGTKAIVEQLRDNKLPKPKLYRLQLASGHTPPSEGILLNANGQITAQAVGYGDDHYLPFNLKNLKSLKGGQYIRTRSVGGPTSEDIYTGLMTGARRVTVVSRSGVFTVEFEDDFRGGRRHNDKARRMTRRYEELLDAVQSRQVEKESVPDRIQEIIQSDVDKEYGGAMYTAADRGREFRRRLNEYKDNPEMTDEDEKWLELQYRVQVGSARNEGEARAIKRKLRGDIMAEKETRYTLNGRGYEAALDALQEQFPYYIKTHSSPLDKTEELGGGKDKGYVQPGRNRPHEAMAGLYGVNPQGVGGKFHADEADFQGVKVSPRSNPAPTPEGQPAEVAAEKAPEKPAEKSKEQQVEEFRQKIELNSATPKLRDHLKEIAGANIPDQKDKTLLNLSDEEIIKPERREELEDLVRRTAAAGFKVDQGILGAYEAAAGRTGRADYPKDQKSPPLIWPTKPFNINEPGYQAGTPLADRLESLRKVDGPALTEANTNISGLTDKGMEDEFKSLHQLREWFTNNKEKPSPLLYLSMKVNLDSLGARNIQDVASAEAAIDRLHRVRTLTAGLTDGERTKVADDLHPGRITVPTGAPHGAPHADYTKTLATFDAALDAVSQSTDPRARVLADKFNDAAADLNTRRALLGHNPDEFRNWMNANSELFSTAEQLEERVRREQTGKGPTGTLREVGGDE